MLGEGQHPVRMLGTRDVGQDWTCLWVSAAYDLGSWCLLRQVLGYFSFSEGTIRLENEALMSRSKAQGCVRMLSRTDPEVYQKDPWDCSSPPPHMLLDIPTCGKEEGVQEPHGRSPLLL